MKIKSKKVSVTLFHDTRRSDPNDRYPLCIRIYNNGKSVLRATGLRLSKIEYRELYLKRHSMEFREIYRRQEELIMKANKIVEKLGGAFSIQLFDKLFSLDETKFNSESNGILSEICELKTKEYVAEDQHSMIDAIRQATNSFEAFWSISQSKTGQKPKQLTVYDITPKFLQEYENYMVAKSLTQSPNGAGAHTRHIKILIRYALDNNLVIGVENPFLKYKIRNHKTVKLVLNDKQLDFIFFDYQPQNRSEEKAIEAFKLSFFLNGANAADFSRLRVSNIKDQLIIFYRHKVSKTSKHKLQPIRVPIVKAISEIINKAAKNKKPNDLLFPILNDCQTSRDEMKKIDDFNHKITQALKKIQIKLGWDKPLNMKYARHNFASYMERNGVPLNDIRLALGHTSLATTVLYLGELESGTIIKKGNDVFAHFNSRDEAKQNSSVVN